MTDFDALYAAVLARPHDDTPRLVMADYLDDQSCAFSGRLGRFIRTQYAIANFPEGGDPRELEGLRQQEGELWGSYPETDDVRSWVHSKSPDWWYATWPILPHSYPDYGGTKLLARHGFVDVVCGTTSLLLGGVGDVVRGIATGDGRLPELVKVYPIREVRVLDFAPLDLSPSRGESSFGGSNNWLVGCLSRTPSPQRSVPDHIWHRLTGEAVGSWTGWKRYPSEAEAVADASRASLEWARDV